MDKSRSHRQYACHEPIPLRVARHACRAHCRCHAPEQHPDGISITSLLKDPQAALPRDALYWHYPHYRRTKPYGAIRKGDWKLIEFFEDGTLELFDLAKDPREQNDLAKAQPARVKELHEQLIAWRQSVGAQMPTPNPNHDPNAGKGKRK